ncbi:hypothetical protein QOZ80_7BG0591280 [Eleusine coracana subsp. coracana]|nr:hypothetical protein QOZ80_7BG0591280 [Eleusine coracana subsp. coracana]
MDLETPSSPPLHVVVFPWLAFGHMIPFLELSKRLAWRGHDVTFVCTPRNAVRLGAVPPELSARVRVATLELPAVEGLPKGAESTADVPQEKVGLLKKALDGLAAQTWVWPIAEEHEIAWAMMLIIPVSFLAFVGPKHESEAHPRSEPEDYMVPPPWIPFPSTLAYRRHEAEWMAAAFRPNASGVSDSHRFWQMHRPSCRLIVHRSCPEAEPLMFELTTQLFGKPVVPAGLLLPDDLEEDEDDPVNGVVAASSDDPSSFSATMRWLDAQPRRSVLYVALGSEAPVTAAHVLELARGLELSGARFLWALRRPTGLLRDDGFEARVAGRGVVSVGWVPQVRVLAHAAVGAFLTHCGWGSVGEGLFRYGHPLVMLPFIVDQGLIARAMAERGVGVEVPRNDDGSFCGEDVAAAVRQVMDGEALSRNARELQKVVGDRVRQEQYIDELVDNLQRYK